MFQGIRELKSAPGRTALITSTIAMIALMVGFLSALAAGLGHRSISALEELAGNRAIAVADSGTPSIAASRLSPRELTVLDEDGGIPIYLGRTRIGDDPVTVLSSPGIPEGHVRVADSLAGEAGTTVPLGTKEATVDGTAGDLWLDHQAVVLANQDDVATLTGGAASAVLLPEGSPAADHAPDGVRVLTGDSRWDASASYTGEQMSLGAMIWMLYAMSALVVGAFFTVWTMQRMRSVAVASALGAARRVLIADALAQAVIVLVGGITVGMVVVAALGAVLPDAMPAIIDASTTLAPAGLLAVAGLIGTLVSLRPVLTVQPRTALTSA